MEGQRSRKKSKRQYAELENGLLTMVKWSTQPLWSQVRTALTTTLIINIQDIPKPQPGMTPN